MDLISRKLYVLARIMEEEADRGLEEGTIPRNHVVTS
jgi:hypothetical protein